MLFSTYKSFPAALIGCCLISTALAKPAADLQQINEVKVTADFFDTNAMLLPTSTTILDANAVKKHHASHLDQLLGLAPNVNFATGASRGRFIQIRGIGERSEFIEPVNYSVGLLIDGIDFTGIGTAATALDIKQVEVLRGPQGTLYGANALAGLINISTNGPTEETEGNIETTVGNYNTWGFEAAVGGAISDSVGYRFAAKTQQSDGYIDNTYLGRDDTANIDENSFRGKLNFSVSDNWNIGLTALYVDIDNGYDAFNYESSRNTRSNTPGHDRQETSAFAITSDLQLNDSLSFSANLSANNTNTEYSFDEDWRNPDLCIVETCTFGPDGYHSAFDNYKRDNNNHSADFSLKSDSGSVKWVTGVYYRKQRNDLNRTYIDGYGGTALFSSDYDTENTAIYGDYSLSFAENFIVGVGARIEFREADYVDSGLFGFDTDETLWGGKLSLSYLLETGSIYATISRGFKAGGANSNSSVPVAFREYNTETLLNYELGLKSFLLDGRLETHVAIFYQDRNDIQTDSAIVTCATGGSPCTFDDYLTNAAEGSNYGLEAELAFALTDATTLYTSFGLLNTQYGSGYINYQHVDADSNTGTGVDMNGRDQPHAPSYQFVAGITSEITSGLTIDFNLEGKDDFLFSNDHDVRSDAYVLVNADVTYTVDNVKISVWGKNLNDEEYQNRAFGSFPNDPRDGYSTFGPYYQLSDPRTFGITAGYSF